MTPALLVDISANKLFEDKTVDEVENVQKILALEIERKREEVRTLVGERYRDLIEAADKIKEMKELSTLVIEDVNNINVHLGQWKQWQHKSTLYASNVQISEEDRLLDATIAQISILVELPEMIWEALNNKDYLVASQLFLLGRHIKTNCDIDKRYAERVRNIIILDDLWRALAHFPRTIVAEAERELMTVDVSYGVASVSLASIHLLQNISVVDRFFTLRTEALRNILDSDQNVQEGLLNGGLFIINSLQLLKTCFVDQFDAINGLVWHKLSLIARGNTSANLLDHSIGTQFLPPVVTNFKLSNLDAPSTSVSILKSPVEAWLETTKSTVMEKGTILVGKVDNLQNLNALKSRDSLSDVEWDSLLDFFQVADRFKLWDGLFKPILAERSKGLITASCDSIYRDITQRVTEALIFEDTSRSEMDLRCFIWKDAIEDLEPNKNFFKAITLKSKAIIPKVANICYAFNNKLGLLYKDLSGLYNTEDMLSFEIVDLRSHQQNMCLNIVLRLKEFIRDAVSNQRLSEIQLSEIARFLQAIPELCPMLQKCLALGETKGNAWHEVKSLLHEESLFCWNLWEDKTINRIKATTIAQMKTNRSYGDLLNDIPQWNIMWIGEDSAHKSQLKVPAAPSMSLQTLLHQITTDICRVHLPRLINETVMQKLLPLIFEAYYDSTLPLCPSEAFQILFDLKYLAALYIPVTNKELNALCLDKIGKIEASVDPIDLEVFAPLIRKKVKEVVQKTQGVFGSKYMSDDNVSMKIGDDPGVIALSKVSSSVWFPLLPLSNPINRPLHIIKPKALKIGKQINEESSKSSSLSSTSFFSDWFS